MAEDGLNSAEGNDAKDKGVEGLGQDDVKTGVYEGGFKSWECSVDLVRVLATEREKWDGEQGEGRRVLEMGCGTALPSLALLQWHLTTHLPPKSQSSSMSTTAPYRPPNPLHLTLADYNPTVLTLVTLPNILLTWALARGLLSASEPESEFEIDSTVLENFLADLEACNVELAFVSGAWSQEFVGLVTASSPRIYENQKAERTSSLTSGGRKGGAGGDMLVLAAETIYSPFALQSFAEALMGILAMDNITHHELGIEEEKSEEITTSKIRALVGAKKVYFGVGGSIEDFLVDIRSRGANVWTRREEEDGVRRAVVEVSVGIMHHTGV